MPEIGEWTVLRHEYAKSRYSKWDSRIALYFHLQCKLYDNGEIIQHRIPLGYGVDDLEVEGKTYEMVIWKMYHFYGRSSIEDLSYIRLAKQTLFKKNYNKKEFEIFIAKDLEADFYGRTTDYYDDIYFYINQDTRRTSSADIECFIVPRIFFIKLEEQSLSLDFDVIRPSIRFTIIVQQFDGPEKTAWSYHRLEIFREGSALEIQINDLGPVPRSEWEPDWPDPADTPLWKDPESSCAQCE